MVMRIPQHTEATIEVSAIASMIIYLFNNTLGGLYIRPDMADHIVLTMLRHEVATRCMWSDVNARMGVDDIEAMVLPLDLPTQVMQYMIYQCNLVIDDIELLISEYLNNILPTRTWDTILILDYHSLGGSVRIANEGDYRINDWALKQVENGSKFSRVYKIADLGLVNEIPIFY